MTLRKNLHWFIYLLFTISCARQTTPTGGPKDTIPPTLTSSNPKKNQILFKGKTVDLTFSEMITLSNAKEQIIIAPSVDKEYEISFRNKSVKIEFENDLKDSTTYTINFRDAVQDITEKNPVKNLQLAFSTGTYVDSLSISGTTYDLLKGAEVKDVTVAIYESDTFNIFKHKPTYLTKSDDKGKFKLTNLKNGTYYIYATDDKNRNIIADSRSEAYGFLRNKITLTHDTSSVSIPIIRLDARLLKLSNARPYNNYFNIKTSKNLLSYKITIPESNDTIVSSFGEDHANIRIYNTLTTDSLKVHLSGNDSIGNKLDTTLFVKFNKREVTPEKYSYGIDDAEVLKERGTFKASFSFNKPSQIGNIDSILYQIDSLKKIQFQASDFTWNYPERKASLFKVFDKTIFNEPELPGNTAPQKIEKGQKPAPKKTINQLIIGKGAFLSVDNDTTKHLTKDTRPAKTDELGVIKVSIKTTHPHYVTTLFTKDGKLIRTSRNQKNFDLVDIPPGDYILRLVIDNNNNGKWDPGSYFNKAEPEPVVFYENEKGTQLITLKANWELGPLLITY